MSSMRFFRIRRKSDGLFSVGGQSPKFTKKGKIWQGLGPLKNHLNLLLQDYMRNLRFKRDQKHPYYESYKNFDVVFIYQDCELVEYEPTETAVTNLMDIF